MTAEQLQDALGLLPSDLVQEADAWRCGKRKRVVHWRRYVALAACMILVLGSSLFVFGRGGSMEKLTMQASKAADTAAPDAPAAMAPEEAPATPKPESAAEEKADNSLTREEPAEDAEATCCAPPVDTGAAQFYFGELSAADEIRLIKTAADLAALDLGLDVYEEAWFREYDLLLIALPGITSPEGLEFSVGQGADALHWEIRIENLPEARVDCADSLLVCIPVQKGHIPRNAEFDILSR